MPDQAAATSEPSAPTGGGQGGSRLRMRNWRLRTKVIAVIVVPTLTALVVSALRAAVELDRAEEFRQTVSQVDLARNVTGVVHELQKERTLSVVHVADGNQVPRAELDAQVARVDQVVAAAQKAAETLDTDDAAAKQRYNIGLQRLSALDAIRNIVNDSQYPDTAVYAAYAAVLDAVVRLGREINTAVTDRDLLRHGTVIQALSEAKENVAKENAILQIAAKHDRFPADLLSRIRDAQASAAGAVATYRANASSDQLQLYSNTVSGPEVDNRQRARASAIASAERSTLDDPVSLGINAGSVSADGGATVEHLRAVEIKLLGDLRDDANILAEAATESAWRDAAIVLAALLVALALMLAITGSLLNPLRVLRREALNIANHKLPASVRRILADPNPVEAAKHAVEPVPIFTTEETGELARSFDAVQQQAIFMATEQALLRDNINSIFVNLSRRSQALVERQLSLIDRLEQDEQDPDQLANLFDLDHLATRMRRNSESLLVLSGTGLSRQFNHPVPASDVVGAAVSEVEQYARIKVLSAPEVAVQGRAVSDLVHVIAELLDNATFFSGPEVKVIVRLAMTREKELAIQITDHGIGMPEEEIAVANVRLADPPDLDVAVTRRMGLYVVARLAKRHNITVRLRVNEDIEGGLIARINVPADLVQPQGTAARSVATPPSPPGTSAVSSSLSAISTTSANSSASTSTAYPSASTRARNSGIAGAFTGNMPRLRPDHDQVRLTTTIDAVVPPAAVGTEPEPSAQNTRRDEHGPVAALFGNPLPEPSPAAQHAAPPRQGDYPTLGAAGGTALEETDQNVDSPTERLPIYDAVLSQWFDSTDTEPELPAAAQTGAPTGATHAAAIPAENRTGGTSRTAAAPLEPTERAPWTSPGDDGWMAAQALLEDKISSATTKAGLPKRLPKARLMPGSAAPRPDDAAESPAAPPQPPRSADAIRGRMSSFQQGVRRGRHSLMDAYVGDQSGLEGGRQNEGQQ